VDCARIWQMALNDYMGRLNLPLVPDDLASITRFHGHLLATDPERFWVAVSGEGTPDAATGRAVAFVSAVERGNLWFLSMLFVLPEAQGMGLGRDLLARVLPLAPDPLRVLATVTDSAQPISNALYSTYGMVPRMPLLNLVGRPAHGAALEPLPDGVRPVPFEEIAAGSDGTGHRRLVEAVDAIDGNAAGFSHPQDHRFLRIEGRRGFLYLGATGEPLGYGYTSEAGRVGPVAVHDTALLAPVLGHLLTAVEPRGAFALWVPGHADEAVRLLLAAGLRLEGFPVLACWTRQFADFTRYIPISPGLL
jgi:GNAT superfamily N-acetyltransferase